jgi:DNA-binding transcriptional LysR family regulator
MDALENLRTFVAVAETGSLVGAARHLGVAASVVTKRVDQLEWRVRARLFTRSTRRVSLTELGARYLADVRRLVHDSDELFAGMSHSNEQVEGQIRIKVPTPMAVGFMADMLAEFQQQFPLVSLDVVLADRAVDPNEEGFDISIGGLPAAFPGVIDELICPLHRLVCASPDYLARRGEPGHPRELAEHDCLIFWPAGKIWAFESAAGLVSVAPRPKLSANDMVVLTAAAIHGNGIALLPTYAVAKALQAGRLVEVMKAFPVPQVWIKALVSERRASIPRVRSLLTFIKARLTPVPPWDQALLR